MYAWLVIISQGSQPPCRSPAGSCQEGSASHSSFKSLIYVTVGEIMVLLSYMLLNMDMQHMMGYYCLPVCVIRLEFWA